MSLALLELRRARLRFGLLAGAVALLVFLVLLLATLSSALIRSFTGALDSLDADVVVYAANARENLQSSRLEPVVVTRVAAVPGVVAAAGLATTTVTALVGSTRQDISLFGVAPDGPGSHRAALRSGRLAQASGEIALDATGTRLGQTVTVVATGQRLRVVGLLEGARFSAQPTAYGTLATHAAVVRAVNPGLPYVPLNAVVVRASGDAAAVADRVAGTVPATRALTRSAAVAAIPGVSAVRQSFSILTGITFAISVVVVGFFFLILTVQKIKVFTLLRGLGAGNRQLALSVAGQAAVVVLAASAVAVGLLSAALAALDVGIPVAVSPRVVATTVAAVLLASLAATSISVRRIAAIDPFAAAGTGR